MSVSKYNYRNCPKCDEKIEERAKSETKKINELYGKIPPAEFLERMNGIKTQIQEEKELNRLNLREDYEIDGKDNTIYFDYSCRCEVCGFSNKINKKFDLLTGEEIK